MRGYGWNHRVLWIDLGSKERKSIELDEGVYRRYVGGKGLGAYILHKYLEPGIDPLGPENIFIMLSGPLQGLPAPNVGRWSIVTKSPLTGIYLDSHSGGSMGLELKKAGYDAVCITGKASEPCIIAIENDVVSFHDAQEYWGLGVYSATEKLHGTFGEDHSVYCIGPAGENKVLFASGTCDTAHRTGRGGAGAVLGSKNLKAVVARGTNDIPMYDRDAIVRVTKEFNTKWRLLDIDFKQYGTKHLVEVANAVGQFPTRNWRSGYFDEHESLSHITMAEKYGSGSQYSCPHCIMRCTHAFTVPHPYDPERKIESMIEYESIGLLGGNLGISNALEVLQLNFLCDDLGLDTISTGTVIGFAIEAFEKEIITEKQVGFGLGFGDAESAMRLIQMIASKEGFGESLADGVREAASNIGHGSDAFAVHVKGLEIPAWDSRGRLGQGMLYATADIGASHLRGWPPTTDPPDRSTVPFVEKLLPAKFEKTIKDCLVVCHFTNRIPLTMNQMRRLLNGATGMEYSMEDMDDIALRIETLIRWFNVREGISREDDILPPRMWEEQVDGPRKGMKSFISRDDFDSSISKYYELMGWDSNGHPTDETLKRLEVLDS